MPAPPPPPPVPVWGIEAGAGFLRAVRATRTEDGKLALLSYDERRITGSPPEALAAYVRKRGLAGHPLVVAIVSPAPHFGTVALTPEELLQSADELREGLLERVQQEPETIDLRYVRTGPNVWTLCAEERARVESAMVALEACGASSYGLVSSADAFHTAVRHVAGLSGDAVLVHVRQEWTEVFFLDGGHIRRQSLPIGARELAAPEKVSLFGSDFAKLLEYHRTRVPRAEPERILLFGVAGDLRERTAATLPVRPQEIPVEESALSSGGKLKIPRAGEILALAPDAVGAAAAGAMHPRRLDLAFRALPDSLSVPAPRAGAFLAAAAVLWLALAVAVFGAQRAKARITVPPAAGPVLSAADRERLESSIPAAARAIAYPRALEALLALYPGEKAAPYLTETLELTQGQDGVFEGRLVLRVPGFDPRAPGDRGAELAARGPPEFTTAPDGTPLAVYRLRYEVAR